MSSLRSASIIIVSLIAATIGAPSFAQDEKKDENPRLAAKARWDKSYNAYNDALSNLLSLQGQRMPLLNQAAALETQPPGFFRDGELSRVRAELRALNEKLQPQIDRADAGVTRAQAEAIDAGWTYVSRLFEIADRDPEGPGGQRARELVRQAKDVIEGITRVESYKQGPPPRLPDFPPPPVDPKKRAELAQTYREQEQQDRVEAAKLTAQLEKLTPERDRLARLKDPRYDTGGRAQAMHDIVNKRCEDLDTRRKLFEKRMVLYREEAEKLCATTRDDGGDERKRSGTKP